MAMSFSRPDPGNPAQIAEASFATGRRGFDQEEVRDFLRMVATEMSRLSERVRFLEREVDAAQTSPEVSARLDEETLTRLLGEETARVLSAARTSAAEIREKAEQAAAQLVGEASDEAARLREDAELESSRRRADAAADAEAEIEMAKQQGREMVNEARAYRERVLSELSRRRDAARAQIEQLVEGRDRLVAAFEQARVVAVDVMSDLEPLGEPDQYVNLAPTTGPVPVMVARDQATPPVPSDDPEVPEETAEAIAVEEAAVEEAALDAEDLAEEAAVEEVAVDAEELVEETAEEPVENAVEEPVAEAVDETEGAALPSDDVVVDLFARLRSEAADVDAPEPAETDDAPTAEVETDDTAVEVSDAEPADSTDEPHVEVADEEDHEVVDLERDPFERRDAELTPLIVSAARKLKRVLADEQNDVLETLRNAPSLSGLTDLVPVMPEQAGRYVDAIAEDLLLAAQSGAGSTDPDGVVTLARAAARDCVDRAGDELAERLIVPLRSRLERSVIDADGDVASVTKSVRALYREVKTQHIDDVLDDVFRCAHGAGQSAAIPDGASVIWVVDGRHPGCPDGDDNALSPPVEHGQAFPTGHCGTPAHPGCRCMLQITRR